MSKQEIGPLILGASGKVGRALRAIWPVHSQMLCQYRSPKRPGRYIWDMLNEPAPDLPHPINGIVGLMGVTNGDAQTLSQNTDLALAACDLAEKLGGIRVLLASSQAVYGASADSLSESSPCQPKSSYGIAKLAMEESVASRPNVTCLRIGNIMGCDALSASMASGPVALERFSDGKGPTRMMIGPRDLARSLAELLAHKGSLPPVLNLASEPLIAMEDLLTAAGANWSWDSTLNGGLASLKLDLTLLRSIVPVSQTDAENLIEQARATGWELARS